jgi:thiamine biosynthesis lipoprotein
MTSVPEPSLATGRQSRITHWLRLFLMLVAGLALAACGNAGVQHRQLDISGATMGTTYSIKVVDPPAQLQRETLETQVNEELAALVGKFSTFDPQSELKRFNHSRRTRWIPASAEMVEVLREARRVSESSGGAFDVTVGPLVDLWGFGPPRGGDRIPSGPELERLLSHVGYRKLEARNDPPAIRKLDPDLRVDLSAIAKGYAVDQVAQLLETRGISRYLVEIGGELRGLGRNGNDEDWRIGIETPSDTAPGLRTIISIDHTGVATSGDYHNYFLKDGQRYSHEIDPRTGKPVTHMLASVTVISPRTMHADAMATALMVLGPDAGFALATREGLAAYFIIRTANGFVDRQTAAFDRFRIHSRT